MIITGLRFIMDSIKRCKLKQRCTHVVKLEYDIVKPESDMGDVKR